MSDSRTTKEIIESLREHYKHAGPNLPPGRETVLELCRRVEVEPTPEAAGSEVKKWKIYDHQEDGVLIYRGPRRPQADREYIFQLIDGGKRNLAIEVVEQLNEIERLRKQVEVGVKFLESAIGESFGFCRTDASGKCGCKWHQELESCLAKLKGDQP